jgi:hypothetical protein
LVVSGPLAATAIARRYDAFVAGYWRGEAVDQAFLSWLTGWWRPGPVGELNATEPHALSPHGGAGRGIAWFENDLVILGVVRGAGGGCYVIPRNHALADRSPLPPVRSDLTALPALARGTSPRSRALAA